MGLFKLWCFGSSSRTRPACGRSATLIRIGDHNADLQGGMSIVPPEYPTGIPQSFYVPGFSGRKAPEIRYVSLGLP